MNKDIKQIAFIYIIVVLVVWLTCMHFEAKKNIEHLKYDLIEAKKVAVEINSEKNDYIKVLQESRTYLNNEIDSLNQELKQYKYLDKIKKDLDRSN